MKTSTDNRILSLMIEKTERLITILQQHSRIEIEKDYILSDAIQFEFEKLYEDGTRLSPELRMSHQELHIDDLRSIRNRVAHEYEKVSLKILFDTIENDIPLLKDTLEKILSSGK